LEFDFIVILHVKNNVFLLSLSFFRLCQALYPPRPHKFSWVLKLSFRDKEPWILSQLHTTAMYHNDRISKIPKPKKKILIAIEVGTWIFETIQYWSNPHHYWQFKVSWTPPTLKGAAHSATKKSLAATNYNRDVYIKIIFQKWNFWQFYVRPDRIAAILLFIFYKKFIFVVLDHKINRVWKDFNQPYGDYNYLQITFNILF